MSAIIVILTDRCGGNLAALHCARIDGPKLAVVLGAFLGAGTVAHSVLGEVVSVSQGTRLHTDVNILSCFVRN